MTNITEEKNSPLEPIKCYGITITFKSPLERDFKPFSQYNYTRVYISKILGESCVDFRIMPEFTIQGRIHYHGILKIKNFAKWVRSTLPSLRAKGFIKIETFKKQENHDRWVTYMYKSKDDTKDILKIKGDIEVTMKDYKDWKAKEPTIERFVGKPKIVAQVVKQPSLICQLPTNAHPDDYNINIKDDGTLYYTLTGNEINPEGYLIEESRN